MPVLIAGVLMSGGWSAGVEKPADRLLRKEVRVAVSFWAERGVTACPDGVLAVTGTDMYEATGVQDRPGSRVLGAGRECKIALPSWSVTPQRRRFVDDREYECRIVVHEVGHALGLRHAKSGVMRRYVNYAPTPWVCLRHRNHMSGGWK